MTSNRRQGGRWTAECLAAALQTSAAKVSSDSISRVENVEPATKSTGKATSTRAVNEFLSQVKLCGLPAPSPEYRFFSERRWRFDGAWPSHSVAFEYEGGIHHGGSHTRGARYESDIEKYNRAALLGWIVVRFSYDMAFDGRAIRDLLLAFRVQSAELGIPPPMLVGSKVKIDE